MSESNKRFLHLGVAPIPVPANVRQGIQNNLDKALDWLRYADNCWIVYTGLPSMTWAERLRAIPEMENFRFLITEIGDYAGYFDQQAWDWLRKPRPPNEIESGVDRDRIVGMPGEYALNCPPIVALVSQGRPGWNITVRLLNLEKSQNGISDLEAAKNAAIAYARELCRNNRVTEPKCLDFPDWTAVEGTNA